MKQLIVMLALAALSATSNAAVVYTNDFETNAAGMSGAGFLASSQGYAGFGFGQQYFRNASFGDPAASSVLNLSLAGNAVGVTLNFDFAAIDSWDGFNCCGPDFFNVKVGGATIYTKDFDIFGAPSFGPELTLLVFGPNLAVAGWGDQGYHISLSLPDLSAGAHTIEFFASGTAWQGGDDESFAIDNLRVEARVVGDPPPGVPEPSTSALLGLGLAGIGAAVRRRRAT